MTTARSVFKSKYLGRNAMHGTILQKAKSFLEQLQHFNVQFF